MRWRSCPDDSGAGAQPLGMRLVDANGLQTPYRIIDPISPDFGGLRCLTV